MMSTKVSTEFRNNVNGENSALKAPEALMVHFCIFLMIVLRNQEYINTVLKTVQKTY